MARSVHAILVFLLLSLGTALRPDRCERAFLHFKKQFHKKYATPEEGLERFAIFKKNYALADAQNKEDRPYMLGVTEFSDKTPQEIRNQFHGRGGTGLKVNPASHQRVQSSSVLMNAQNVEGWAYTVGDVEFSDDTPQEIRNHLHGLGSTGLMAKRVQSSSVPRAARDVAMGGLQVNSFGRNPHFGTILQLSTSSP